MQLFDHLVGEQLHRIGDSEAKCFGRLHIDDELELCRLLNWQVGWLLALENTPHIVAGLTVGVGSVSAIAHKTARQDLPPDL